MENATCPASEKTCLNCAKTGRFAGGVGCVQNVVGMVTVQTHVIIQKHCLESLFPPLKESMMLELLCQK